MKSISTSKPPATAVDRWSLAGALLLAAYFPITASFRDPAGSLFRCQGRVPRVVNAIGALDLAECRELKRA